MQSFVTQIFKKIALTSDQVSVLKIIEEFDALGYSLNSSIMITDSSLCNAFS
jgi:hypothetical protein